MLSSFRRLSKSKIGTAILIIFLLTVLASFALGDISKLGQGGGGLSQGTLARVGSASVTDSDLSQAMELRLRQLRQQNPAATNADLAGDFDAILDTLLQQRTLEAYAAKHGMIVSPRLIGAEIATIPGTRGLDGKFSDAAYQQFLAKQRLTDNEVRREISGGLLQRLVLTPVAANTRMPLGVARPYASMLLEQRDGEVGLIPTAAFRSGTAPTDAQLQAYYNANKAGFTVPEQRVVRIARIGTEQLGPVAPTDAEIAAYYNANQAIYGAGEQRVISRAVVPDQAAASAIAARARTGPFAAAAAPAGFSATGVDLGAQSRAALEQLAGKAVADQAFAAAPGSVIGPIKSDLGWNVVKVERIAPASGRTLAQAKSEIAAKLSADKRKEAIADLVGKIEDQIGEGRNFAEVASANKLPVTQTPPLTANGQSRGPGFKLAPEFAALVKTAFDMAADEDPTVETLPGEAGYALVAVGDITAAAPAPFAAIRDVVAAQFITKRANDRAKAVGDAVVAKLTAGVPMAQALAGAGVPGLPAPQPLSVKRIQLSQSKGPIPPPLQMLFSLPAGKSRLVAAPNGQGFFLVKLNRIVPGNAAAQPTLVAQVQSEFNRVTSEELAVQFILDAQRELGVKRDEAAIAAARKRLLTGG
jgi:peptidyl-prolyl cis-trans isomerase D